MRTSANQVLCSSYSQLIKGFFCCYLFVCFDLFQGKLPWAEFILTSCWCNFLCSSKAAPDRCGVRECRTSSSVGWVKFQVLGSQEIYNQERQKVRNHVLEQEVNILSCIWSHRHCRGLVHWGSWNQGQKNEPLSLQSTDILHLLN